MVCFCTVVWIIRVIAARVMETGVNVLKKERLMKKKFLTYKEQHRLDSSFS